MSAIIIPGRLIPTSTLAQSDTRTPVIAGTYELPGISCDTVSDLPSTTYFDGLELIQDSYAHIVEDNTIYCLKSSGTWIQQDEASRLDVYTKAETDAAISNALSPIIDALVYLVDQSAKNLVNIDDPVSLQRFTVSSGVLTSQTGDAKSNLTLVLKKLSGGSEVTITSFGQIIASGYYYIAFQKYEDDTQLIIMHSGSTQDYKAYYDISQLQPGQYVAEIYVDNYLKANGAYTLKNLMVCKKILWDISSKNVPYCPTLYQLYQMILSM